MHCFTIMHELTTRWKFISGEVFPDGSCVASFEGKSPLDKRHYHLKSTATGAGLYDAYSLT